MSSSTYEQIAQAFHERIDTIAGTVDSLVPGLEAASVCIVQAALADQKIFVLACDDDAAIADYVANTLRSARGPCPPLPAVPLIADVFPGAEHKLWMTLKTLSRDGDVVLCLDSLDAAPFAGNCAAVCSERNLTAISVSEHHSDLPEPAVRLVAHSAVLRRELMMMTCHCLVDQIRLIMIGE